MYIDHKYFKGIAKRERKKKKLMADNNVSEILKDALKFEYLVVDKEKTYDVTMNSPAYTIMSGDGSNGLIPNLTSNPNNVVRIGDIVDVIYEKNWVRGVIINKRYVWFYFEKTRDLANQIIKAKLNATRDNDEFRIQFLQRLDDDFNKLPRPLQLRIEWYREMIPDYRFLYEEREIELLNDIEEYSKFLSKKYGDYINKKLDEIELHGFGYTNIKKSMKSYADSEGKHLAGHLTSYLKKESISLLRDRYFPHFANVYSSLFIKKYSKEFSGQFALKHGLKIIEFRGGSFPDIFS